MQGAQGQTRFLPFLPGGYNISKAVDISGDGMTVVGYQDKPSPARRQAFRWNEVEGSVEVPNIDTFVGPMETHAVNYDGTAIVGVTAETNLSTTFYAFRWTPDGTENLTPNGTIIQLGAMVVSDDGTRVAGFADNILRSWLWKEGTGLISLEEPSDINPAIRNITPTSMSGDGTLIGGFYTRTDSKIIPGFWDGDDASFIGVLSAITPTFQAQTVLDLNYDGSWGAGATLGNNAGSRSANISHTGKVLSGTRTNVDSDPWWTVENQTSVTFYGDPEGTIRRGLIGGSELTNLPSGILLKMAANGVVYSLSRTNGDGNTQACRLTMLPR